MSRPILVAFASKHESTVEVAEVIAASLTERDLQVDFRRADDVEEIAGYGGVVLGGALYMGRLHRDARRFLHRHRETLASLPFAVFAMGPKTLDAPDVASSRAQLEHALDKVPEAEPFTVAVFGGVVDPQELDFPFNRMPATDARDWDAIHAWATQIATRFGGTERVAAAALDPVGAASAH
jgi:menaquinone-dependent protoporphyrinogen oxidase